MRTATLAVLAVLLAAPLGVRADDIQIALDKAKGAYEAELTAIRKDVAAELEKLMNAARKKGEAKALDRLKEVEKVFDQRLYLPDEAPYRALTTRLHKARGALAAAYGTASAAYGEAKQAAKGDAVLNELARLQESWDSLRNGSVWHGNWTHQFADEDKTYAYTVTLTVEKRKGKEFDARVEFVPKPGSPAREPALLQVRVEDGRLTAKNKAGSLDFDGPVTIDKLTLKFRGLNKAVKKRVTGSLEVTLQPTPK